MRILLVSATPPPAGGIATWTERYLQYCHNKNLNVSLVNTAVSGGRAKKIINKTNVLDEIARTRRILKDMRSQVKMSHPDVVHLNTSCGPLGIVRDMLCARIAYKKHIPIVTHFHCNIQDWIKGRIAFYALKQIVKMSDKLVVLNSQSKQYIRDLSSKDATVIPNFIDESFLEDKHLIRGKIEEVVFVGHVQIPKGIHEIMEAAKTLKDIHFTLVGPVADNILSLECPDNISMIGARDQKEVKEHLKNADVYLFPSYTEGFSLSLTEAMASGLPVIATDVGANRDMIEDKGGIIIRVKDAKAIVDAMNKLEPKEAREEMSAWVINKVKNNYTTATVMDSLLNLYSVV